VSINGDRSSRWLDDECVKLNIEINILSKINRKVIYLLNICWLSFDNVSVLYGIDVWCKYGCCIMDINVRFWLNDGDLFS
jgi:hypothetical protein